MKYFVEMVVVKSLYYGVEAENRQEAINKVYLSEVEPYESDTKDKKVVKCYPFKEKDARWNY